MSDLSCAIRMRALMRLSLRVEIHTIGNIKFFSQKPEESLDD
jgi:hypothetical protein